jgi:formate dehydrogenase subunit delta
MSPEKLVMMANQIARFFASQGEASAVPGIAEHIKKFWDPRMRKAMLAHLETPDDSVDPLVRAAFERLRG